MKKRFGFTLAEVLITLGIIGVVAAMTIPTLIQNSNGIKFASQYKKTLSTLAQAGLMAQAQYDVDYAGLMTASDGASTGLKDENGQDIMKDCTTQTLASGAYTMCGLFNNTLSGQTYLGKYGDANGPKATDGTNPYKINQVTDGDNVSSLPSLTGYYVFSLADGSYVGFNPKATQCSLAFGQKLDENVLKQDTKNEEGTVTAQGGGLKNCIGFIDVNGPAGPNREILCTASSTNKTKLDPSVSCDVTISGATMGDVFPIVFHDGAVEPASNAARMVFTKSK